MMILLWAAPASAQSYGDIFGVSDTPDVFVASTETSAVSTGDLARTGQSNITPMVQVALVLMGAGTLLVVLARRRHVARRTTV